MSALRYTTVTPDSCRVPPHRTRPQTRRRRRPRLHPLSAEAEVRPVSKHRRWLMCEAPPGHRPEIFIKRVRSHRPRPLRARPLSRLRSVLTGCPSSLGPPLSRLRVGTAVRLRGSWVPSDKREQFQSHELKVNEVEVLGPSDPGVRSISPSSHPTALPLTHVKLRMHN